MKNRFIQSNKQISLFITAGYPALESTTEQILLLQKKGVDFIEVGIPFSDPMADGPVIQQTSSVALANGMQMDLLFEQLNSIKDQIRIPLVMMGYLNPVLQYGLDKFLVKCKEMEIASVILPDMSLEIYERFHKIQFETAEIPVSFLITPLTQDERIKKIAEVSKNSFVYLVSKTSITGEKNSIDEVLVKRYKQIKNICGETPVMLGFGIQTADDVRKAHMYCDGAIIGSAFLTAVKNDSMVSFLDEVVFENSVL